MKRRKRVGVNMDMDYHDGYDGNVVVEDNIHNYRGDKGGRFQSLQVMDDHSLGLGQDIRLFLSLVLRSCVRFAEVVGRANRADIHVINGLSHLSDSLILLSSLDDPGFLGMRTSTLTYTSGP